MASEKKSPVTSLMEKSFRILGKLYLRVKKPVVIVTAGSVGKTSTKIFIGQLLASERRTRYMRDSYNSGLGLYMSVFNLTVPEHIKNPIEWLAKIGKAISIFFERSPEFLVMEYGIDHVGDMDDMLKFCKPDISVLTAITPEHMEYLIDIDTVAQEETKILRETRFKSFYNVDDVDGKYIAISGTKRSSLSTYGSKNDNEVSYKIGKIDSTGAEVTFYHKGKQYVSTKIQIISEPLIRQLCGAIAVALRVEISSQGIISALDKLEPAPSRMRLLRGKNGSSLIDDSVNFSPVAGIRALETLHTFEANRRLVVFGNMHELGDYEEQGFSDVAGLFKGIDMLVFVGPIAKKYFVPKAEGQGFIRDKNLFVFDDAISAGNFVSGILAIGDVVLIKGPFGGYYLEECTKILLENPADSSKLIRQSDFWQQKKRSHFGRLY